MILVVALYWPVIFTGFRDSPGRDEWLLVNAVRHRGMLRAYEYFSPSFWQRVISSEFVFYRPVALISHAIDYDLWGSTPHPSHAANIAVHAAAVLLLGWLVALLAGNWLPGMLASVLYAMLPSHAEPVSWIAARMDLLAGALALCSMISLVLAQRRGSWGLVAVGVLFFLLALGAKETGGALALVIAVWALAAKRGARRIPWVTAGVVAVLAVAYVAFRHFTGTIVAAPQLQPFRRLGMRLHTEYLSFPLARLWQAISLRSLAWADWLGLSRGTACGVILLGSLPTALVMLTWRIAFYLPTLVWAHSDDRYLYVPEMGSAALLAVIAWRAGLILQRYRPGLEWMPLAAYGWLVIAAIAALREKLVYWLTF